MFRFCSWSLHIKSFHISVFFFCSSPPKSVFLLLLLSGFNYNDVHIRFSGISNLHCLRRLNTQKPAIYFLVCLFIINHYSNIYITISSQFFSFFFSVLTPVAALSPYSYLRCYVKKKEKNAVTLLVLLFDSIKIIGYINIQTIYSLFRFTACNTIY